MHMLYVRQFGRLSCIFPQSWQAKSKFVSWRANVPNFLESNSVPPKDDIFQKNPNETQHASDDLMIMAFRTSEHEHSRQEPWVVSLWPQVARLNKT